MAAVRWLKAMLDEYGVSYRERHHVTAATATELAERVRVSGHRVAKVVVVIADGRPVELVLPASRNVQMELVAQMLGVHEVRLASEGELGEYFSECELGAIPPLRHGRDIAVWLDNSLDIEGDFVFSAGTHEDAIELEFCDWLQLVKPRRGNFSTTAELRELGTLRDRATIAPTAVHENVA